MKSEKIMQMKHVIIICLHSAEVITDFIKAFNLVCSHKMFEKNIHLSLEKKNYIN